MGALEMLWACEYKYMSMYYAPLLLLPLSRLDHFNCLSVGNKQSLCPLMWGAQEKSEWAHQKNFDRRFAPALCPPTCKLFPTPLFIIYNRIFCCAIWYSYTMHCVYEGITKGERYKKRNFKTAWDVDYCQLFSLDSRLLHNLPCMRRIAEWRAVRPSVRSMHSGP